MTTHCFIPDTQVSAGVPLEHLRAAGNYIVDKKPDVIIHIGDHADMPSLSSYEKKESKYFHDKSYKQDIDASLAGMEALLTPLWEYNNRCKRNKKALYRPRMVLTMGNHEQRIVRAVHSNPVLESTIGLDDLKYKELGWEVHPFLAIARVDGIAYSHYFVNPDGMTGMPVGGTIESKLKLLGCSFSMGHQQKRQYGMRYDALGRELHGLVWGSFYLHDEDYLGPQKNRQYKRGIMMKHEVKDGSYDPMMVSMEYLLTNYL